jgi:hypothetical protein
MLQTIPCHAHAHPVGRVAHPVRACSRSSAAPRRPIATVLRTVWGAWRESLAAHRHYERLQSRGVPHDTALREALAMGPANATQASTRPLHFAGKA